MHLTHQGGPLHDLPSTPSTPSTPEAYDGDGVLAAVTEEAVARYLDARLTTGGFDLGGPRHSSTPAPGAPDDLDVSRCATAAPATPSPPPSRA